MGSFRPNAFGLHDVHGNVWEWCRDRLGDYDKNERAVGDGDLIVPGARVHVSRGGGFFSTAADARCAFRGSSAPGFRRYNLGCRAARGIL